MISRSALAWLLCLLFASCWPTEAAFTLRKATRKHMAPKSDDAADDKTSKDDADDEDDDEDDDDEADAKSTKKANANDEEEEVKKTLNPHASEEARLKKQVKTAKQDLDINLRTQVELKNTIKHLSDEDASDQQIDSSAKLVGNETESPAMGAMLGSMWKDLRMFETPFYAEHVAEELHHLKRDEQKLGAKVVAAETRLSSAQKKWGEKKAAAAVKQDMNEEKKQLETDDDAKVVKKSKKKKAAEENDDDEDSEDEDKTSEGDEKKEEVPVKSVKQPAAPPAPTNVPAASWSFWHMTWPQQKSALLYSFVYLLAGTLIAVLYKQMRVRYASHFTPAQRGDMIANPKDFSFSLFGCFADPKVCVVGCLCPSLRWADTLEQRKLTRYWKAFFAFFILVLLHTYSFGLSTLVLVAMGTYFRQKLRKSFQIESGSSTILMDLLAWTCCTPCAIVQETRELGVQRNDV